jgi:hypothetical protein
MKVMPQHGRIVGYRLDGWRFAFLKFVVLAREVAVLVRATPPWSPFPQEVLLTYRTYGRLVAISGERAKRLPAQDLIDEALMLAGVAP